MKKVTEGTKSLDNRHPAEIENAKLRLELADERTKTEALARHCIKLGEAFEAAIEAEDDRAESDMFAIINSNCDRRKAAAIARKRRDIRRRKASDACMRNSFAMVLASMIALVAVVFCTTGIINPTLGTVIVGSCLIAFGWTSSACIHLLRVVEE
jgi:hypothetical protein